MTDAEVPPVSAYIITFNNARTLERTLKSLTWVDEIIVVDSYSTDTTREIAAKYTDNIEQRTWPGFRDQYQYASSKCRNNWLLFADADEELSQPLIHEIQDELRRNSQRPVAEQACGYEISRRTFFLGHWIRHGAWIPDREIRLYRNDKGEWKGALHAKVHVSGPVASLQHYYFHYTYENLAEQINTVNKYSETAACDLLNEGKKPSLRRLLANPIASFVRNYFFKGGFLDGLPGLIIAINTAFYIFTKYAKLWEKTHVKGWEPQEPLE